MSKEVKLDELKDFNFKVKGNTYKKELITQGDLFDIESLKSVFSRGMYGQWLRWGTNASLGMVDTVDMYAVLSTLFPKFVEDLKVDSIEKLSPIDVLEIKKAYDEQVKEKFNNFMILSIGLSSVQNDEKENNS